MPKMNLGSFPRMHVGQAPQKDQERWLRQRGWTDTQRGELIMWRHPETGIPYHFTVALKLAREDVKLEQDFEVKADY